MLEQALIEKVYQLFRKLALARDVRRRTVFPIFCALDDVHAPKRVGMNKGASDVSHPESSRPGRL
jgi:hypothetical protein